MITLNIRTIARRCAYILFWSWNIIFLVFMLLGFVPTTLPELINAVRTNTIPAPYLVFAVFLVIIPLVAIILGLTVLRRSPGKLLALGYGVEGPLMLILAIRFFAVRQATPIITLMLVIATLGLATFLWQLLDQHIDARRPLLRYLHVAGLALLLAVGLYAGAWVAFYAVPTPVLVWKQIIDIFSFGFGSGPSTMRAWWVLTTILGLIGGIYTATLFVAMPIAVPFLYTRAWWRGIRRFAAGSGRFRAALLTAAVLTLCVVSFVLALRQPQHQAFAMLEKPPSTPEEANELLGQQETIRAGLLNAYLAPARYISAVGEVYHIRELYVWAFGLSWEQAAPVQQAYEVIARPMLYESIDPPEAMARDQQWDNRVFQQEPARAADLYKRFFDVPIVDAERVALVQAARSTWMSSQAESAWKAVDDREIHLEHQEIAVTEHGDWAEVELYEVYQNKTDERQEVVYYFSLPESAVVTGVWLGNSPSREERFTYRVSPRGAAQDMYLNQVRYSMDPALVEQIGPRQYRLRVFPIEPRVVRWNSNATVSTIEDAPDMHMWLTYRVLAGEKAWPLPHLAEKRNVYWDSKSERLVNSQQMQVGSEDWLPASVPASSAVELAAHRVDFPGGQTVVAQPISASELPEMPGDLHLAVVLDRSRSMASIDAEVEAALVQLNKLDGVEVDAYLTASAYRGEEPSRVALSELEPGNILYYGGQNAAELLVQFDQLQAGEAYDTVLVLTDGTGYELGGDDEVPLPDAPVWMVHLSDEFPLGYDDATLQAIQASGGGVAGSIDEALTRLAVASEAGQDAALYDVVDGYMWQVVPADAAEAIVASGADQGFEAFAARRLILAEMVRSRGQLNDMGTLDALHAIAVENSVVTPYSSMIVLVTDRQQQQLDQLEKEEDRFLREHEEVGEAPDFSITGVPEPEEWLLLGLAAVMLLWYARKRVAGMLHRHAA